MKKFILPCLLFWATFSYGQTIFSEDFEASTNLPTGWQQYNVDGKTPASSMNFMGNKAWIVRDYTSNGLSKVAVSTSYYSPVGKSNDWLVTPKITLPVGDGYLLAYDIMAPDADYPDNYEVWISTDTGTVESFTQSGTKLLAETGNPGEMKAKFINLTAYAGQDVYIAFRNVANDKYLLFLDNVNVSVFSNDDIKLENASHNRLSLVNTNNTITYTVFNKGANAVTSIRVKYSDGTNDIEDDITVSIASLQSKDVQIPTPLNYSTIVEQLISHEIMKVNGNDDANPSDNTFAATKFNTISEAYDRTVVIEEGTGTWCGWCPMGAVNMDMMHENHPQGFIGIAVHNGDPMAVTPYDNGAGFSAFPGCNVDRVILGGDVEDMENYFNQRKNVNTLAFVEGEISSSGTSITINAKAKFNTIITNSTLRLGVVMVEDNVSGTASGYAQTNYFEGNSYGAMGGFESLPDPVPADQMVYDHVGRALLGGYDGQINSVPTTIDETTQASYTFNYTIPSGSNKNNMYAVILLIDNETGEIYNAAKYSLAVASTNELETVYPLAVYPNPSTSILNVELDSTVADYTVTIYDLSGKQLIEKSVNGNIGVQKTTLDVSTLAKGSYIVTVATAGQSYTKHFVKN